jgi:hypothetical protein
LAGLARQIPILAEDCVNYGSLYISEASNGTIYLGGMISAGDVNQTTATTCRRCTNNGNIYVNADVAPTANNNCFIGGFTYRNLCPYVFEDCSNNGDIILKEGITIGNSIRMGGFIGTMETAKNVTFDNCSNGGDIIVPSSVICGNTTASKTGYIRVGGIVGNQSDGTITVKNGVKNSGTINVAGECKHNQNLAIGGVFGYTSTAFTADSEAVIINEGEVIFGAKSKLGLRVGGVIGAADVTHPATVSFINTGNISCTGTFADASRGAYIGGVFGNTAASQANAQSFCNINAIGYTGVGLITGSLYSAGTVEISNSAIGGTVYSVKEGERWNDEYAEDFLIPIYGPGNITAENYHKCIYGAEVDASIATANNVTVLTSAPSTELPAPAPEEPEATEPEATEPEA